MGRESEEVGRGEGTDGKQVGAGWEAGDPSGLDREEMENKMRDKISKARQTVAATLWEPLAPGQGGQGWLPVGRPGRETGGLGGPGTALGQAARSSVHAAVSPRTVPLYRWSCPAVPNTSPLCP